MAFPVIESTTESSTNTAGTSHAITLPASIAATDLVLIIMDIGSTAATLNALTDWGEILDENSANGLKILWYTGAGVPGNPTFTSSASTRSASIAFRISGVSKSITPQIGTTATGTSATPDPPTVTPSGSVVKDYLFIAFFGAAGEEADDNTWSDTPPTNYLPSPPLQKACGTAGTNLGGLIAAASRQLNTGSAEDPGTFTKDVSAAWRAQTIIVHPLISATVDQASETETAFLITPSIGLADETDTAQPVTAHKLRLSDQPSESDAAQAFTARKTVTLGQTVEADTSQAIAVLKTTLVGQASETDTAQAFTGRKTVSISQAAESDTAQTTSPSQSGNEQTIVVDQATETDTAQAMTSSKVRSVGQASETDSALPMSGEHEGLINQATEVDDALSIRPGKALIVARVTEIDEAQPMIVFKPVGQAIEADAAFGITVVRPFPGSVDVELELLAPSLSLVVFG